MSFRKPVTVKRVLESGRFENGRWIPGDAVPADVVIMASVQPAAGKVLESLPEGRRTSESYVLYTDVQLFTADTSKSKNPDMVMIQNREFEVIKVLTYQSGVINHYQVIVSIKE